MSATWTGRLSTEQGSVRITGWREEDVVGKHCFDEILCHIDKDGHKLAGAILSSPPAQWSPGRWARSVNWYMQLGAEGTKNTYGSRSPLLFLIVQVSYRRRWDFSWRHRHRHDMERAKTIQQMAMKEDISKDTGLVFTTHYIPEWYHRRRAITRSKMWQWAIWLSPCQRTGHGVSAALYTMHLSFIMESISNTDKGNPR